MLRWPQRCGWRPARRGAIYLSAWATIKSPSAARAPGLLDILKAVGAEADLERLTIDSTALKPLRGRGYGDVPAARGESRTPLIGISNSSESWPQMRLFRFP